MNIYLFATSQLGTFSVHDAIERFLPQFGFSVQCITSRERVPNLMKLRSKSSCESISWFYHGVQQFILLLHTFASLFSLHVNSALGVV